MRNTDPTDKPPTLGPPIRQAPTPKPEWVPMGDKGHIQRNTTDGTLRNVPPPPAAQRMQPKTIGDYDMLDADLGYTVQPKSKEMRDLPVYKPAPQVSFSITLRDLGELRSITLNAPAEWRVGGYTLERKADHD